MQEDEAEDVPGQADVPADAKAAAGDTLSGQDGGKGLGTSMEAGSNAGGKRSLSHVAKGAIFREVVMAKVREAKEQEEALKVEKDLEDKAKRNSFQG